MHICKVFVVLLCIAAKKQFKLDQKNGENQSQKTELTLAPKPLFFKNQIWHRFIIWNDDIYDNLLQTSFNVLYSPEQ